MPIYLRIAGNRSDAVAAGGRRGIPIKACTVSTLAQVTCQTLCRYLDEVETWAYEDIPARSKPPGALLGARINCTGPVQSLDVLPGSWRRRGSGGMPEARPMRPMKPLRPSYALKGARRTRKRRRR